MHTSLRLLGRGFARAPVRSYAIYFLKGNDPRQLTPAQQQEVSDFVKRDPLSPSFIVYNRTETLRKINVFRTKLPWINLYYAMKANPIDALLRDVVGAGVGIDCASRAEIQEALNVGRAFIILGLRKSQMIYSNPVKDQADLKWAGKTQIQLTTADAISELVKIKTYAPNIKILWRLAVKEEAKDNLTTPFSVKFGDDLESEQQINNRMKQIKDLGIKLHGIHFHCGSGRDGSSGFTRGIDLARQVMKIGRTHGHPMEILDIGGGFPAGELHDATVEALKSTEKDPLGYKVMAEPGRHLCANSCYILVRVIGLREKGGSKCYHLNDSLYHAFNCVLMDGVNFGVRPDQFYGRIDHKQKHRVITASDVEPADLFGMTCDGLDVISRKLMVPKDVQTGDWLSFGGMGAYTYGPRSRFNGMRSLVDVCEWEGDIVPYETKKPAVAPA